MRFNGIIPQDDLITTSPGCYSNKLWEQKKENLYFDIGDQRMRAQKIRLIITSCFAHMMSCSTIAWQQRFSFYLNSARCATQDF